MSLLFHDTDINIGAFLSKSFCVAVPHSLYVYGTSTNDQIRVKDKYQYTCNGYTYFMLIDMMDRHFCVNNTIWYWKWDSIEDWNRIQTHRTLDIRYYGYRIPCLGFFPIIFCMSNK